MERRGLVAIERRDAPASTRWAGKAFREELRTFVGGAAEVGDIVSLEPLRLRPWSTVWRVETTTGLFWAKQNCPGQAHEARLLLTLGALAPDALVPVTAADPGRDLLLTPDQGLPLAQRGVVDVATWQWIVREAALLQRATIGQDLALAVLAPQEASDYAERRVGELSDLAPQDPRRLDAEVAARLRALLPQVARWSDEVSELDLPLVLNHNDLHADNVLEVDGSLRFFDLGDALVTEPLAALRIPLNVASADLDAPLDDPRLVSIAEAALEVWSDVAPLPALRAALPAALALGRLARVEAWLRCLSATDDVERAEYGAAPARWLETLLGEVPGGG